METSKKQTALYYDILNYQSENLETLQEYFDLVRLKDPGEDKHNEKILSEVDVAFAPLGYFFGGDKMNQMPNLKVIASNTTGDPHIDVQHARKIGVEVITLKNETSFLDTITPTAELTWGLLIALTRNLIPANKSFLDGVWNRRLFGGCAMLSKMSLGIVGLGRLGQKVAKYGEVFGMNVSYYDPFVDEGQNFHRSHDLHSLIRRSDVISLHVPHEPSTTGMFDRKCFDSMRPGSFLINTARGELIDFGVLLEMLQSGRIGGAALDVFEGEFEPNFSATLKTNPLRQYALEHSNLVVTPHIGGSTLDAWKLTESLTIQRVVQFMEKI